MPWLIDAQTADAMQAGRLLGLPTATILEFEARAKDRAQSDAGVTVEGGVARIDVIGVLTPQPDIFAWLFGGGNTTYSDIRGAIADANGRSDVSDIQLYIDSPGGSVEGLFSTMDAISASEKPIHTIIVNKAASAAYGLASQSSSINAENDATRVGSVGTVIEMAVPQDTVVIASSNAPNKRPDPRTEEGRAVIQAELDDIANLFSERIARGRGVSIKKINADFGRGGVVLAKDAINRGMIDSIGPQTIKKTSGKTPEANMDLNELKSKHPDVYAAAVTDGVKQERDRVSAHLELGEAYAALDTAIAAVKSGDAMSMAVMAKYVAAGANRGAIDARQKEDPDVPGTGGSDNQDGVVADRVLARAFELCGVSVGGAV